MYGNEKGIQARYLEYITKFTNTTSGIYTRRGIIKFKETPLFGDQVKLILPETFCRAEIDCGQASVSEYHLRADISNLDQSVCFTFHLIDYPLKENSVEYVIEDFERTLKCLNPESTCLGTGSGTGELLPYSWIEFSRITGNKKRYHMLTVFPVAKRLLLFLFDCPLGEEGDWRQSLSEINETVRV